MNDLGSAARHRSRRTVGAAVALVAGIALIAVATSALGPRAGAVLIGAEVVAAIVVAWVLVDASARRNRSSAEFAEQRTSEVVLALADDGWTLVDNVEFDGLDVDHVAIGPGGVVVLETKWVEDGLFTRDGGVSAYGRDSLEQAERHAEHIRTVLAEGGVDDATMATFVVVWGTRVPGGFVGVDGRTGSLVDGRLLGDLLAMMDAGYGEESVELARTVLAGYTDERARRNTAIAEAARRSG